MNVYRQMLELVRDLKLKNEDLPPISYQQETELLNDPVMITRDHIVYVLKRYKQERLSLTDLYTLVHFIWFSDFYVCRKEDADSIASVIHILEELEEEGCLFVDDVDYCLDALEKNDVAQSLFGNE